MQEARERNNPEVGSSLSADDAEQRVQQEIIEMLTTKLRKKEKDTEILRRQLESMEGEVTSSRSRVAKLEDELRMVEINLKATIDELQNEINHLRRDAQQAHALAERFRGESTSHRVANIELRRQYDQAVKLQRTKEQHQEELMNGMKHELSTTDKKLVALDASLAQLQQRLHHAESSVTQGVARITELQSALESSRKRSEELEQQLAELRTGLAQEIQLKEKSLSDQQLLQEKLKHLTRTLQQASSRATEADKKRVDQGQVEAKLSDKLVALHSENEDLRARNNQLIVLSKQQQSRLLALESRRQSLEAAKRDAMDEVEHARKSCREYQFRVRQLQEEVTFLTKKKSVSPHTSPRKPVTNASPSNTSCVEEIDGAEAAATAIPTWMRT